MCFLPNCRMRWKWGRISVILEGLAATFQLSKHCFKCCLSKLGSTKKKLSYSCQRKIKVHSSQASIQILYVIPLGKESYPFLSLTSFIDFCLFFLFCTLIHPYFSQREKGQGEQDIIVSHGHMPWDTCSLFLISTVNDTPKAATPCQCLHQCFIIYCSSAVLNIEFSISSCTFLWNSFPIYFSISEILIYLSSCSHCEVTGWYYSCSMTWSWHMQDPEDIIRWNTSHEKWLGPWFQSRTTLSVWAHSLLIAVSFCEHTTSGS